MMGAIARLLNASVISVFLVLPVALADTDAKPSPDFIDPAPAAAKEDPKPILQPVTSSKETNPSPAQLSLPPEGADAPPSRRSAVSSGPSTQSANAVTVFEVTQMAIDTNPDVQARWHGFLESTEAQRAAWGGFLPKVDLNAGRAREDRRYRDNQQADAIFNRADVGLSLTQMIYDGFATLSQYRSLGHSRRASYFELLDTTEQISLEAYTAFEDVRRFRERLALAQDNLVKHKEVFKLIAERVQAGVGRSVDLEQVTGRLALAQSNVLTEQSNLHDVTARYRRITGVYPAEALAPIGLETMKLPPTREAVRKHAMQSNPALLASTESVQAASEDIGVQQAKMHPRFDLRLRGDYGDDINQINGESSVYVAELLMNYNLFNGGSDSASIRQSSQRLNAVKELQEKTCRDVLQTVDIAYNDVTRIGEQLEYLDQHQLSIAKAREAYRDQFDIGQRSLLDLLDTENEYFDSRRAYLNGLYDHSIAHARTMAATGSLVKSLKAKRTELFQLPDIGSNDAQDQVVAPCRI